MEQQVTDISNSNIFLRNIINRTYITITCLNPTQNVFCIYGDTTSALMVSQYIQHINMQISTNNFISILYFNIDFKTLI